MLLNLFVCVISFSCALLITVPGLKLEPQDKETNKAEVKSINYHVVCSENYNIS